MQRSALLQAYAAVDYAVFSKPPFSMRIGEPSAPLDALLRSEGVGAAAFITACNPRGERRSDGRVAIPKGAGRRSWSFSPRPARMKVPA